KEKPLGNKGSLQKQKPTLTHSMSCISVNTFTWMRNYTREVLLFLIIVILCNDYRQQRKIAGTCSF
ncbi:MAG TPA: hypothetical protein PKA77_07910, partial [Chitinophagaceae bacterium]|nr:hypothetical protein [Chitinophagaceae bacterium]HMU58765.1 hypothetical protein [Chitinophagaceae bacterium]